MTTELLYLLSSVALMFVLIVIPASIAIIENGVPAQAGSRDSLPEPSVLLARCRRLVANMQENLIMFAIVVILAHLANVSNDSTVLGAQLFFYGRLAHAVIYIAGLPWIRPLAWGVSVAGMVMIALQLI